MLSVLTPDEVLKLIETEFFPMEECESVGLDEALGRTLGKDIEADEYVPSFDRSTVDGYALRAADSFGCSEAIPAILSLCGEVLMGQKADFELPEESCCYVPTGGAVPAGADCVVMIEYTENYGDGTIGIMKPGAPGLNMIYRGDDVFPGKKVLQKGRKLSVPDIGALAAMGIVNVPVAKKVKVGIISTGDELVPPEETPEQGQVRDVNSPLLSAMFKEAGAEVVNCGIVADSKELLRSRVRAATETCDMIILSGGSSVGVKDAACEIIESMGSILFHGIAVKPGKPTIMGKCGCKPIVGLPGHPVAAYFVAKVFVLPLLNRLTATQEQKLVARAVLSEAIGANHGRAQFNAVNVKNGIATPVRSKSGLITQLAGADGYIRIERDCEGLAKNSEIEVYQ